MLLVTTALLDTWEGENEDLLFLGEWCKTYENRKIWNNRITKTLTDPWSNRLSRQAAYNYTKNLRENILIDLANSLNKFHNKNFSINFWRTLIGPWLNIYVNSVYHKWECLRNSDLVYNITYTNEIQIQKNITSCDFIEFEKLIDTDEWNYSIALEIIKYKNKIKINKIYSSHKIKKEKNTKVSIKKFIKITLKYIFILGNIFTYFNKTVIINSYLPLKKEILLNVKLGQLPSWYLPLPIKGIKYNFDLRQSLSKNQKKSDDFYNFISKIIFDHIPINYIEGFAILLKSSKKYLLPINPKFICTANNHWWDDIFKSYMALNLEKCTKIKIISHGGGGKFLYDDFNDHEIKISDKYFTWGWDFDDNNKCYKGILVKTVSTEIKRKNPCSIILVTYSEHRYLSQLSSMPSYDQFINIYLEDQYTFVKSINFELFQKLKVRLHHDLGNQIKSRFNDNFKDLLYSTKEEKFFNLLKSAKVVVITYNCTTIVETLALNIPTIVFWDENVWELSHNAKKVFENLYENKIFHKSPLSAAAHLNNIFENVEYWWNSSTVQLSRKNFIENFGKESNTPLKVISDFIKK